jgi:hypothetical protein
MTPIEWIAAVMAVWIFIKFIIMMFNPKVLINWGANLWKKDVKILKYFWLILFFAISYFVLQEINIILFFAAMLAGLALMAHTLSHYPKVMRTYISQFKGKNPNAKIMFDWLIWLLISAWVLKVLFF